MSGVIWECEVLDREGDVIDIHLRDTAGKRLDEVAAMNVAHLAEKDRPELLPGAVFYWEIDGETGGSKFTLRRRPRLTAKQRYRIRKHARREWRRMQRSLGR